MTPKRFAESVSKCVKNGGYSGNEQFFVRL
jgi:hypothetical protein